MQTSLEYTPGGTVGKTDAGPSLPAGMTPAQYLAIVRQIQARSAAPAGVASPAIGSHAAVSHAASAPVIRPSATPGVTPGDPNAGLKAEAEAMRLQAMMAPPPMRMTTFASNANNGYMPDVNAMNGFQRQIFLPDKSAQIGDDTSSTSEGTQQSAYEKWAAENAKREPYLHGASAPGLPSTTGY